MNLKKEVRVVAGALQVFFKAACRVNTIEANGEFFGDKLCEGFEITSAHLGSAAMFRFEL